MNKVKVFEKKGKKMKNVTKEMVREHKRIVPELKKAGLRKEAERQARELLTFK